jgi:signal transduction histidine kinase
MFERVRSVAVEHGFGPPPEAEPDAGENRLRRAIACGAIAVVGVLLLVPNALSLSAPQFGLLGDVMAVLGVVISLALLVVGVSLYPSGFGTRNAIRISLWMLLGAFVLGAIVAAHAAIGTVGDGDSGLFLAGNLLAIGAGAHVIIGVVDARRVRAEQLAAQQRRLAVLNRVIRHNLRNEATVLQGHAQQIVENVADEQLRRSASAIERSAGAIGGLSSKAKLLNEVADRGPADRREFSLPSVVDRAVDAVESDHPDVPIDVDVPTVAVRADDEIATAIEELLQNAIVHSDADPNVRVRASRTDGRVRLAVHDDGPGIPDQERQVLMGELEITPLVHGSGLGLWLVGEVADASGGELEIERREDGTTVWLELDAVDAEA